MARKKVTTTEEEIEDPKDEKEIDYKKDIEDKSLKEIASENKDSDIPKVEDVTEKADSDIPKEVKEDKPEIDLEENNRKIAEEASKRTRAEIADLLKGEDKKETKDAYEEWADKYTEDNGKAPTWVEAAKFIKDTAKAELIAEQQEAIKAQEEAQTKQAEQEKTYEQQLNAMMDEELAELYSSGKLTRIKNAEDPNDPGVRERKALMQTMYDVNVARAKEQKSPIYSVARIHSNYYKPVNAQPAGADAMLLNNRAGSQPKDDNDYDYVKDIKGKGWKSFFKR